MIISEIEKNQKECIRVSLEEYKGHEFIDCRVFWKDRAGEWKPSEKGVSLNDETLKEVITVLSKTELELEKKASQQYAR
ncbi:MAG: Transcriptional Coactivator p15 (PC4) [Syntrophorhabdus sp. PtaB.Bin184]|nr:MAG: Transcriptional Coactivator p15 (PC4) [Syntrophorhabdus sp. PtaB.Bin184]